MTLRKKTLVIVFLTFAVLIVILYGVTRNILLDSFSELENQNTRRNVERAISALSYDISTLDATASDWAGWDDTYEFIEDGNADYRKANLGESTFTVNKLNLLLFVNPSGHIVFGKGFDLNNQQELPVPNSFLQEHLSTNGLLLSHNDTESSVTGTILLPEGPMLIASRPIVTSERKGPIRGTLIMGRYLDSTEIKRLAEITHLSLTMQPFNDTERLPDFQAARSFLSNDAPILVKPFQEHSVAGYALLRDIYGSPGLLLRADMSREIFEQGQASAVYFILSFIAVGLIFGLVILLLLEKVVLSRLARLSACVSGIGVNSDFSMRAQVSGKDEISSLASAINVMLEAVEKSRAKYKELVDLLPEIVFEIDVKGNLTLANLNAYESFGYTQEEISRGFNVFQAVVPEERDKVKENMQRMLNGEHFFGGNEYTLQRKDGGTFPVVIYSRAIIQENKPVGLRGIIVDITRIKRAEEALRESEEKYRTILDNIEDGYFEVDVLGNLTFFNDSLCRISGYTSAELMGMNYRQYTVQENASQLYQVFNKVYRTGEPTQLFDWKVISKNRSTRFLEASISLIRNSEGQGTGFRGVVRDITERKQVEEKLKESEEKYRLVFENSPLGILHFNKDGIVTACNDEFVKIIGSSKGELIGINLLSLPDESIVTVVKKALSGEQSHYEGIYQSITSKKVISVKVDFAPIMIEDNMGIGGVGIVEDITERKLYEEQLKYLSLHDSLTGLYNRVYFEQEMRRIEVVRCFPVGMIVCDVDGLKLVNDTLGHDTGDALLVAATGILRESFRGGDVVARIGGDEFAVLLPNSPWHVVESAFHRIRAAAERHNAVNPELPLSISVGFAVSNQERTNINELFKEADNNMYREKLHSSQNARSGIVQTLMKALEARDFITEGHAERLQDLVISMAMAIGLPERRVTDLRLLAKFHDIGKVGVPDRILFKPGPLTREEAAEMRRHCEIGHRIALSAPDLVPIAGWILKHHERWNGKGYPLGLEGEEIPLECRILAIADAYDAMTSHRPYRQAMSHEEALAELGRCAGTQFDPRLVSKFKEVLKTTKTFAARYTSKTILEKTNHPIGV